jgi:hypothetical protein
MHAYVVCLQWDIWVDNMQFNYMTLAPCRHSLVKMLESSESSDAPPPLRRASTVDQESPPPHPLRNRLTRRASIDDLEQESCELHPRTEGRIVILTPEVSSEREWRLLKVSYSCHFTETSRTHFGKTAFRSRLGDSRSRRVCFSPWEFRPVIKNITSIIRAIPCHCYAFCI